MENTQQTKEVAQRGRKAIISEQIIATICDNVRIGVPPTRACAKAGIAKSTYYSWLEKAKAIDTTKEENLDNLYLELMDRVELAQADFIEKAIKEITKEGPSGYKWMLARLFRKEFGDQVAVEQVGSVQLTFELPGLAKPKHDPTASELEIIEASTEGEAF